jgi:hypothetical protein
MAENICVSVAVLLHERIKPIRRALTPRSDLGLIHWSILPLGRPRLRFVGVRLAGESGVPM